MSAVTTGNQHSGKRTIAPGNVETSRYIMLRTALENHLLDKEAVTLERAGCFCVQRRLLRKFTDDGPQMLSESSLPFPE